jgi:hypothetical protein
MWKENYQGFLITIRFGFLYFQWSRYVLSLVDACHKFVFSLLIVGFYVVLIFALCKVALRELVLLFVISGEAEKEYWNQFRGHKERRFENKGNRGRSVLL